MRIYIDTAFLGRELFAKLNQSFSNVEFVTDESDCYNVEALIVFPQFFIKHEPFLFKNLRWVQLLMSGYDKVDLSKFDDQIMVTNAQNIFSYSIAEDVLTKILVLNRNVKHYLQSMDQMEWNPIRNEPEIMGSKIGILGTGSIGKECAKRLKSFDTWIMGYRSKQEEVPYFDEIYSDEIGLKTMIQESDYLILALPLNQKTFHLIDQEKLSWMKPSALLINVARGEVIDQEALVDALKNHQIRGAGLDTVTPEPLPKNHPLWSLDHCFITPHNASSSPHMRKRIFALIEENLSLFLQNQTLMYRIK